MLDSAITCFLNERKENWLKTRIKGDMLENEIFEKKEQANEQFSLGFWLPGAAKRANQLALVSHPCKFSHPGAKTTPIIADCSFSADGFIRTGNVEVDLDVLGNAAALDVFKFLSLKLKDGMSILQHLEKKTESIKEQFNIPGISYLELERGLLSMKGSQEISLKTSGKVKQVFFPIDLGEYHLLSILTPSGIMFNLRERIDKMRFSEEVKEIRDAKKSNKEHEKDFSEIYGLSVIGFGGTKPQNISVLNNQNGGRAFLLSSMPPELSNRKIRPPKISFFTNTLWIKSFEDDFQKFHNQLNHDINNIHVRRKRDWIIRSIIHQVADQLWKIRSLEEGWSSANLYKSLPHYQKIWLDQSFVSERTENSEWFESMQQDLIRWFLKAYKKLIGDKAVALGDDHWSHIKKIIIECEDSLV